jgi:hypothetical protein
VTPGVDLSVFQALAACTGLARGGGLGRR